MRKDKPSSDSACSFIRSHLVAISEIDVPGEAFPGVQNHLESCPECASLVQHFSRAWEDPAPQEDTKPSASFFPRLIERIEAEERPRAGRQGALALAWRVLKPAAVAAIFLGGIFAGHELGKRDRAILAPEAAFSGQVLESFENIPSGSVADFYVSRQNPEKEGLE